MGDEIAFATNGNSHVHLTGYLTDDFSSLEEESGDEDQEEAETAIGAVSKKRSLGSENERK